MADEPASYLTLEPGTDVLSADGERVGAVEHVLRDDRSGIFDGLVIDTRLGPGGLRFVDAPEVESMSDDGVVLTIPSAQIDDLPEPEENPAVVQHRGAEDVESPLERKLRRAWDLISGRY